MSYLHGIKREVDGAIELDRRRRLEWWIARYPELASHPHILAQKARVSDGVVDRFFQSLVLRNQKSLSDLEKRVVNEALKPENQQPYEGPQIRAAYWLKSDRICRKFNYKYNGLGARRVYNILERQASSILERIAESVFESAYTLKSVAAWDAQSPQKYYACVARAAGTLPKTANYVLSKRFKMPQPPFIKTIAETYADKNMTLQIAAETMRLLKGGQFRNKAQPYEILSLAKHLDSAGVTEPLNVAEGLVGYLKKNNLI